MAPSLGSTGRTGSAGTALRVVVFGGCADAGTVVFCNGERWAVGSGVLVVDASVATLSVDDVVSVKLESSRSSLAAGFSEEAWPSTDSAAARPAEAPAWEASGVSVVVACGDFFFLLGLLLFGHSLRGWVDQGIWRQSVQVRASYRSRSVRSDGELQLRPFRTLETHLMPRASRLRFDGAVDRRRWLRRYMSSSA